MTRNNSLKEENSMTKSNEQLYVEEDTQKDMFMTFLIGNETYGLEINYVTEIIGFQNITEVPELPLYIKGIINLRGKIIPVMDVRLRFKKPIIAYNDRTCIIVIEVGGISVGLIVDAVSEVILIPEQDMVPPPNVNQGKNNKCIKGIGKVADEVTLVLNCSALLDYTELLELESNLQGELQL